MRSSSSGRTRRAAAPRPRVPTGDSIARRPPTLGPALPARDPASIAVAAVAAACLVALVTYRLYDVDLWGHLAVGRLIWSTHQVPRDNLWTWPALGTPYVLPSWLFRALVWPFWAEGGVWGLFLWRWLTVLGAFAIAWLTARRMGATGLAALVALVWCGLLYRQRSQLRPETLVFVLLSLQLWVLESRRRGLRDRSFWLVPIACAWINVHISYTLGLLVTGLYLMDEVVARRGFGHGARRLALVLALSAAVSFLNPFGWQAVAQPFQFVFQWRNEPMYQLIEELKPIPWAINLRNGLPLLMVLVPALAVWRWRRFGFDGVQAPLLALVTWQALTSQRFLGFYVVTLAPFFARDLDAWVRSRRWPSAWSAPRARAGTAAAACALLTVVEVTRPAPVPGVGFEWKDYPVRACDYVAAQGIGGRAFNVFFYGDYMSWRFWPDSTRLPFMNNNPEAASRADRESYAALFSAPEPWKLLDARYRFDWLLLPSGSTGLLDVIEADDVWSLVFFDDAATVFLRRDGSCARQAERDAYRLLPAGPAALSSIGEAAEGDSAVRTALRAELERAAASSPWNGIAHSLLANVAIADGRWADARRELAAAASVGGHVPLLHERLSIVLVGEGRPREALDELMRERRERPRDATVLQRIGMVYQALGDRQAARRAYARALELDPGFQPARDSLGATGTD